MSAVPRAARRDPRLALAGGPAADLERVAARQARAAPVVRRIAWDVYDRYLKSQRVPEGIASYDRVTQLILGTGPERWMK
jgi:hypothetical protein